MPTRREALDYVILPSATRRYGRGVEPNCIRFCLLGTAQCFQTLEKSPEKVPRVGKNVDEASCLVCVGEPYCCANEAGSTRLRSVISHLRKCDIRGVSKHWKTVQKSSNPWRFFFQGLERKRRVYSSVAASSRAMRSWRCFSSALISNILALESGYLWSRIIAIER